MRQSTSLSLVPIALELYLDSASDAAVRAIWSALDARGIPSLGSRDVARYSPHISLAVCESGDAAQIASLAKDEAARAVGLPVTLAALGFFLTEEAPAFLAVVPTSHLLRFHHDVFERILPAMHGSWPYYEPDGLFPHCTLAMHVTDRAAVFEVVEQSSLPIMGSVGSVNLVDVATGETIDVLASM